MRARAFVMHKTKKMRVSQELDDSRGEMLQEIRRCSGKHFFTPNLKFGPDRRSILLPANGYGTAHRSRKARSILRCVSLHSHRQPCIATG